MCIRDRFDTAGLRETSDTIEAKGIDLTKNEIVNADVVVGVFDSSSLSRLEEFSSLVGEKPFLKVLNKIDVDDSEVASFDCRISAKTGEGFEDFKEQITAFFKTSLQKDATFLVRDRHIGLFNNSISSIKKALTIIQSGDGLEVAAEELKIARSCLDVVVGKKTSDQLLGDIFSSFCIGK